MADQTSRPYGSSPARNGDGPRSATGNDPLAELARLIGQTDPFGEYARDKARPGTSDSARPFPDFGAPPPIQSRQGGFDPNTQYAQRPSPYGQPQYAYPEQGFTAEATSTGYDQGAQQGYAGEARPAPGYYDERTAHGDDIYDDAPPARRRIGILAIAAVFALAVLGTASAVGYRALFGTSGSKPPPVIKADSAPLKIAPPPTTEPASNKLITDRVGAPGERIVSREEQPVDIRDRAAQNLFPGTPSSQTASVTPVSGVVGSEPRKIRTIPIRPDQQSSSAEASAAAAPNRGAAPPTTPRAAPSPRNVDTDAATPPPARQQAAAARPATNAPMSLSPEATQAAAPRAAATPTRTASAPPASNGAYAVQVSSQRSEADAQASYRALQGKFPAQLGNRQPLIRRADLGDKGTFYRALVAVGTAEEATQLCTALKAAGGQCIIQRN